MNDNEKIYLTMNRAGIINLILGICTIVAGVTSGILLIVSGARLINRKKGITF